MSLPAFKRKSLQIPNVLYRKIAAPFLVYGNDPATLSYHSGIPKAEVKDILDSSGFQQFIAQVKSNPLDVVPDEAILYSILWMEARQAKSSRDRQAALKVLLEAKQKHSIGSLVEEYERTK